MIKRPWLLYTLTTTLFWGIWGALIEIPGKAGFPPTLVYIVWALTMIPAAYLMTDMNQNINWGFKGPYLAAIVSVLNSIGALTLVYAIRYGKVIIVAPLTNAVAPVITIVLSLLIYMVIPNPVIITGIVFALIAVYLMAD